MSARRRAGLQDKWKYVFDSLESIIPVYERGSSMISLFSDREMRSEAVAFAVKGDGLVLDLGSGPGTMAASATRAGGDVVLLDASRKMLGAASGENRVQAVFEHLPFRDSAFEGVIAGFSLRDSMDLVLAVAEVRRVTKAGGRFSFCDLGKPESFGKAVALGFYIRAVVPLIGAVSGGRKGLGFSSLYETYLLTLTNGSLVKLLSGYFSSASITEQRLGGSIVVRCVA